MASFQKQSDKWTVRFLWIGEDGKEKHKRLSGYSTKKQAERALFDFLTQHPQNNIKTNTTQILTFNELVFNFMVWKKQRVKESTIIDFEQKLYKHVLPYFENKPIDKITKLDVLNWQTEINKKGYSYKYKTNIRGVLYGILNYAYKYYDLTNPVAKVDAFVKPKTKKELHIWTLQQFEQFISVTEEPHTSFFMCLYYLGLRLGEGLALSPNDFDFKTNLVKISKSHTKKTKGKAFAITDPKNFTSFRSIQMPGVLAEQMKTYFKTNSTNEYLFGNEKPFALTSIRRSYYKYIQLAQVPKIRIHDLRHSHASLLIDLGANVLLISQRLGHRNVAITLNTYSHLMPTAENEIITKLDNLK